MAGQPDGDLRPNRKREEQNPRPPRAKDDAENDARDAENPDRKENGERFQGLARPFHWMSQILPDAA